MTKRQDLEALCVEHKVSSHAAKGPLFLEFKDDVILATDYKAESYPPVNFRNKAGFFGGNWNKASQLTPKDVYLTEVVKEEVRPLGKLITASYSFFDEYIAVIPPAAHGNPAQQERVFINPVTLFVASIDGYAALEALKCERENLHAALSASTDFKASAIFPLSQIRNGMLASSPQFIWGDDRMLADVLAERYDLHAGKNYEFAMLPNIDVHRLDGTQGIIPLSAFKSRWTVRYQMKNPLAQGDQTDKAVFEKNPPAK